MIGEIIVYAGSLVLVLALVALITCEMRSRIQHAKSRDEMKMCLTRVTEDKSR